MISFRYRLPLINQLLFPFFFIIILHHLSIGILPISYTFRETTTKITQYITTPKDKFRNLVVSQPLWQLVRKMVTVVIEHMVLTHRKLFRQLWHNLVQTVVHQLYLTQKHLTVEVVLSTLGLNRHHSRVVRVIRTDSVTVLCCAEWLLQYPISTPVWKAPTPIHSRQELHPMKS